MIKVNITSNGLIPKLCPLGVFTRKSTASLCGVPTRGAWPECHHKETPDTSRMRYILQNKDIKGLSARQSLERLLNVTCGSGVDHCKGHYWEIEELNGLLRLDSSNVSVLISWFGWLYYLFISGFFYLFVYGIHTECLVMMWHHASSLVLSGLGEKKFLDFQLVNVRSLKSF